MDLVHLEIHYRSQRKKILKPINFNFAADFRVITFL